MSEETENEELAEESVDDEAIGGDSEEAHESTGEDEPVLSEEEKEALIDGIASGEIEVHSTSGPMYAEVRDFKISPRAHIVSNNYPRLDLLNAQIATILAKYAEKMLNVPVKVFPESVEFFDYGTLLEEESGVSLVVDFTVSPLEGSALLSFEAGAVAQLVECFFGGSGNAPSTQSSEFYTAGEKLVVTKFSEGVLAAIGETWEMLVEIKPERRGVHLSTDLIEGIDQSTELISCAFDMHVGDAQRRFRLLWPVETVKPIIPAFKDQKRESDPAQDARWSQVLSNKVTDSVVTISSQIGQTSMTLRDVSELVAGDIIDISNPRKTLVFAKNIPVLEGLFGIHDGRYAIETTGWLNASEEPSNP